MKKNISLDRQSLSSGIGDRFSYLEKKFYRIKIPIHFHYFYANKGEVPLHRFDQVLEAIVALFDTPDRIIFFKNKQYEHVHFLSNWITNKNRSVMKIGSYEREVKEFIKDYLSSEILNKHFPYLDNEFLLHLMQQYVLDCFFNVYDIYDDLDEHEVVSLAEDEIFSPISYLCESSSAFATQAIYIISSDLPPVEALLDRLGPFERGQVGKFRPETHNIGCYERLFDFENFTFKPSYDIKIFRKVFLSLFVNDLLSLASILADQNARTKHRDS